MKKQILRPDGTVEIIEGTPEEIALYEQQLLEGQTDIEQVTKKCFSVRTNKTIGRLLND